MPTAGKKHPNRSPLKAIELALDMGGSGRLYQRLREEEGLVCSVNTVAASYEDTGLLGGSVQCVRRTTWRRSERRSWPGGTPCAGMGSMSESLRRSRVTMSASWPAALRPTMRWAGIFGIEGLLDQVETFDEALASMGAVTQAQVLDTASRYLDCEHYAFATVGRGGVITVD